VLALLLFFLNILIYFNTFSVPKNIVISISFKFKNDKFAVNYDKFAVNYDKFAVNYDKFAVNYDKFAVNYDA